MKFGLDNGELNVELLALVIELLSMFIMVSLAAEIAFSMLWHMCLLI